MRLDEISLSMRDMKKLKSPAQIEVSWSVNNNIYQDMSNKPQSTLETKCLIQILETKYTKADPRASVEHDCKHLSAQDQSLLRQLLQDFEELFDGTLGDCDCEPLPPIKGRSTAIPWLAFSNTQKAFGNYQKGNPKVM